jgi:hypothetical protein
LDSIPYDLRYDPLPYLMHPRRQAWIKYQTLIRILKMPANDPEVIHWRQKRDNSAIVKRFRQKQLPDGSFPCMPWMHIHEYYFHRLLEMGYGVEDDTVKRTVDQLLSYQLSDGGYMHPTGRKVNTPNPDIGWAACMTGYVIKALMNLGLAKHPLVVGTLEMMKQQQKSDGGWSCRELPCVDESNCIIAGTPWVAACLSQTGMIYKDEKIGKSSIDLFRRYKNEIVKHGYMNDRCYRCDESIVLITLINMGLSKEDRLVMDFYKSLIRKQQSDGSWRFRDKPEPGYTLEVLMALEHVNNL